MNNELIAERGANLEKGKTDAEKEGSKWKRNIGPRAKILQCETGVCHCGAGASDSAKCVAKVWFYCYMCERHKRKFVKKKLCDNKNCALQRAEFDAATPPPARRC